MTASGRTASEIARDRYFWAAVAAALPVWAAIYVGIRPNLDLVWPLRAPAVFAQVAVLYPVLEEIVFRGVIQSAGHRYLPACSLGPISLSNLLTSLVFTAMHFLYHPPLWATLVVVPSLVFGYFKDRHGSLVGPVLLHVFYNTGYYLMLHPLPSTTAA